MPRLLRLIGLAGSSVPVRRLGVRVLLCYLRTRIYHGGVVCRSGIHVTVKRHSGRTGFAIHGRSCLLAPRRMGDLTSLFRFLLGSIAREVASRGVCCIGPLLSAGPCPAFQCRLRACANPSSNLLGVAFRRCVCLRACLSTVHRSSRGVGLLLTYL